MNLIDIRYAAYRNVRLAYDLGDAPVAHELRDEAARLTRLADDLEQSWEPEPVVMDDDARHCVSALLL